MKLRSGKTTLLYLKQFTNYTAEFDNIKKAFMDNIRDVVINGAVEKDFRNKKAVIVNKIYSMFFKKFYEIHDECIHNFTNKEDDFVKLITALERNSVIILKDIEENLEGNGVKVKTLKKNVIGALEKAKNYKRSYKTEQKNAWCLVSCKVGSDLAVNISSYLV